MLGGLGFLSHSIILEYMLKNKKILNFIKSKRAIALATALVLVIVTLLTAFITGREPMKVYARETYSDINQVVAKHSGSEADAFTIVDIVPGKALYQKDGYPDISIDLGTIGYLVSGQDEITNDLFNVFKGDNQSFFMNYIKRKTVADALVHADNIDISNGDGNQKFQIKYEEAYGGTGVDTATDGWRFLYDWNQEYTKAYYQDNYVTPGKTSDALAYFEERANIGYLHGKFEAFDEHHAAGDSTDGFDYIKIDGSGSHSDDNPLIPAPSDKRFDYDAAGEYFVIFSYAGRVQTGEEKYGYVANVEKKLDNGSDFSTLSAYSNNTGLYVLTTDEFSNNYYEYVGKLKNFSGTADKDYYIVKFVYDTNVAAIPVGDPYYVPNKYAKNGSIKAWDSYNISSLVGLDFGEPLGEPLGGPLGEPLGDPEDPTNTPEATETPEATASPESTSTPTPELADTPEPTDTPTPTDTPEPTATPDSMARIDNDVNSLHHVNVVKVEKEDIYRAAGEFSHGLRTGVLTNLEPAYASVPLVNGAITVGDDVIFLYVGPGNGDYKLIETDNTADTLMEVLNAPTYIRTVIGNDLLRRYVFASLNGLENAKDDFKIDIHTILASDKAELEKYLPKADLIYLEDGRGEMTKDYDATEQRNLNLTYDFISANENSIYSELDMNASIAELIIKKLINDEAAIMLDHAITTDEWNYPGTLYQRLARILEKKDVAGYYTEMMKDGTSLDSQYEKLFNIENIKSDKYPVNSDNNYNYVSKHLYVNNELTLLNGDYTFNKTFSDGYAKDGFLEALTAIDLNNERLEENDRISRYMSKARAIQYILIDIAGAYHDLNILEIQPTKNKNNDLSYDKDKKTLFWNLNNEETVLKTSKKEQVLKSDKEISVSVNNISVDQFNSDLENINEKYSFIFIGVDGSRLNIEYDKDKEKKTYIYNTDGLRGTAYNTGDDGYDAIDLTTAKVEALTNYLKAGFPIVLEDRCFENGSTKNSINTMYIADNTKMYAFLRKAKESYSDYIYTVKDLLTRSTFPVQLGVSRPYISFNDKLEGEANYEVKYDETAKKLEGIIRYQVKDGLYTTQKNDQNQTEIVRGEYKGTPNFYFYLDMNCDGVFADYELISDEMYTIVDNTLKMDLSKVPDGVVPWGLEVTDSSNEYRNSILTGFFNIRHTGDDKSIKLINNNIKVLQIVGTREEEPSASCQYDLQSMYEYYKKHKEETTYSSSLLAYMLGGAEGILGREYDFTTLSVEEANSMLAGNVVETAKVEVLDLYDYDVLVLGFGEGSALSGLIQAEAQKFIDEGRPTVISSLSSDFNTNFGLTPASIGLMNSGDEAPYRTYPFRAKTGSGLYRFKKLGSDSLGYKGALYADKINDGIISLYPYGIDDLPKIYSDAEQSIDAGSYLLNYSNNLSGTKNTVGYVSEGDLTKGNVTAWYTLGNAVDKAASSEGNYINAFEASPMDGRNNYYVYSKNNVFYIGQNKYPYIYENDEAQFATKPGVNECELFVNALMGAYNVGIKSPKVAIVAGYGADSPEIESITIPYDENLKDLIDGEKLGDESVVDVYFKASDSNLVLEQKDLVTFYYENPSNGSVDLKADLNITPKDPTEAIKLTPFSSPVWKVENNAEVQVTTTDASGCLVLEANTVYRIKAPIAGLRTNTGLTLADIYVVVESNVSKFGLKDVKSRGYDKVSLNRAQMFMLD